MRYLCHAFQRATQAELRVRVAYRGAFSALKFPSTLSIDNEAEKGRKRNEGGGIFFFDRRGLEVTGSILLLSFFLSFFFDEHAFWKASTLDGLERALEEHL